ncbi:hypothetical protein HYDPIDRAFT_94594 [Hydnomerulius pinastri MD-312]|uniref:Aminoglycoside phosphotransferase domain-containing protein n=1 Tax=Hydnomerulius pinastri MD-312 TaxID=994086 RepID=A0A0C9V9D9_9AGAM|nr:hypothetical protein HYDPIDRAFT_94594 [Hydnomerulius pinastri MD-312]
MGLVASQTTIPVPRVQQCVKWEGLWYLLMDYVEGADLAEVWGSLSEARQRQVAETLHSYVSQLRRVKLPHPSIPGPVNGTEEPLCCKGLMFSEYGAGPFRSCSDLSSWFSRKYQIALNYYELRTREPVSSAVRNYCPDDSWNTLFLTHGDISLTNVRVGEDGKIWLLDWGFSGAYSIFFEYAGIMRWDDADSSWLKLASDVVGSCKQHFDVLSTVTWSLHYVSVED